MPHLLESDSPPAAVVSRECARRSGGRAKRQRRDVGQDQRGCRAVSEHSRSGRPRSGLVQHPLDRARGMMMYHTSEDPMPKTKVAVTVDAALLEHVDALVAARRFANRSKAVKTALADRVARAARPRLARECAKVSPREEQ